MSKAMAAREDIIVGVVDTRNQVNTVLGFPFISGVTDARATVINEAMKLRSKDHTHPDAGNVISGIWLTTRRICCLGLLYHSTYGRLRRYAGGACGTQSGAAQVKIDTGIFMASN